VPRTSPSKTAERRAEARAMRAAGATWREIAERFELYSETSAYYLVHPRTQPSAIVGGDSIPEVLGDPIGHDPLRDAEMRLLRPYPAEMRFTDDPASRVRASEPVRLRRPDTVSGASSALGWP
jgi:predicted flavoprotein YhiN